MFRKIASVLLASSLLVAPLASYSYAANDIVSIDSGKLVNNRVFIPLRAVSENLGANVKWDQQQKTVTIQREDTQMVLTIDSKKVRVNQAEVTLDVPAELSYGATYVPVRFVSQTLGADVKWNQQAGQATIILDGKSLLVTVGKPSVQLPSSKRITDQRLNTLVKKLNEATDISQIKQVRTYFSPYFTDRFINSVIQNKGLQNNFKFETIFQSGTSYTNNTTAVITQASGSDSKYGSGQTLYRKTTVIYTDKGWKVDGVSFSLVQETLNP
ncbi:copper amine oxidase N-terminal domain-containing protein [Paenibacillus solani]|uniref:copper amine oxidase N-terminal domain-containing protein n=1 Tax=Paenibacillus solani TaxID=1705565 RepID=UPI003D2D1E03